jgi:hypothetical protein
MGYATVTIEVDLGDIDDDDLCDELESRGYKIIDEEDDNELTHDEITAILDKFQMSLPGTTGYDIYEKLRKR